MAFVEVLPSPTIYTPSSILPDPAPAAMWVCDSPPRLWVVLVCVWCLVLALARATPRVLQRLRVYQRRRMAHLIHLKTTASR